MKFKRLAALMLAMAMVFTLTVVSAAAVTFTDMAGHWAKSDVEALTNNGLINGYSDGTFKPNAKMTAAEALLFCARATSLDNTTKIKIAANRLNEVKGLLPSDMYAWAASEMAICLETGIITHAELQTLCQSGAISREISRENICFYLVRAMQLAPLAKSLNSYSLNFNDASTISTGLQPYVYLLNMYGIVKGDETNRFGPRDGVTRAVMATMLSRALKFMDDQSIVVELPAYADNQWTGGVITSATTGNNGVTLLAYTALSGAKTISLPASVKIYENNMLASTGTLKAGKYVRVNLNANGGAESVRLGGEVTSITGAITSLDVEAGTLAFTVNGTAYNYTMDHFTEVKTGKTVGDKRILDEKSNFTTVTCQIDAMGHLATADFTGGTKVEEGLISTVTKLGTSAATLQVMGFNGVLTSYKIPVTALVTVNGSGGNLSSSQKGYYVALSMGQDSGEVEAVAVDTKTEYIQGIVRGTTYSKNPNKVTIKEYSTAKTNTYELDYDAIITYDGEDVALSRVSNGWFATLQLSGSRVVTLDCYPGATTTEGVITNITYDDTDFIIHVKRADETEVTFTMDLYDLPVMYRDDKAITFDKLRTGDEVIITVRYNEVDSIEATAQNANVKGTISRIITTTTGVTIDLSLEDGTAETYQMASGVSITQGDKTLQLSALQPGYKVSMVVSGREVVSVSVDKTVATNNMLTGSVVYIDTNDWTLLVQTTNATGNSVVVKVYAVGANIMDTKNNTLYLTNLRLSDTLQIFGGYENNGFSANIIIRI